MLNHDDENIRYVARNSLRLDMEKRNISRSEEGNNFLGYKVKENGLLDTHIKGGFGTVSDWPQLHRLLKKLKLKAQWEHLAAIDLMDAGKALLLTESGRNLDVTVSNMRQKIQELQIKEDAELLKGLKMQGTLFNVHNADYLLSQDIFKNIKFADKLVQFWYKLRHNILPCNFTLSKWYDKDPACELCKYTPESMAHLLNGCAVFSGLYTTRHDKLVNKYSDEIEKYWSKCIVNKTIATSLPNITLPRSLTSLKPDIVVMNVSKVVYLIDVACPYDIYLEATFQRKTEYYGELAGEINKAGYKCSVLPLIIGSCGIVHKKCLPSFTKLGVPKRQAKGLCKFSSNSNILFARSIWARRCSLVFD